MKWLVKHIFITIIFTVNTFSQQKIEVFFDFNQHQLSEESLKKINTWIVENQNIEVSKIYGFCDWVGSNSYNDTLSVKRVNTVFEYLQSHKIPIQKDYLLKGFGKNFEQSQVQSENRKVIIIYDQIQPEIITVQPEPSLTFAMLEAKVGEKLQLKNILFRNNSAIMMPKSRPDLEELFCIMRDNPTLVIEIQGHICCRTDGDVNNISTQRARSVYQYLLRNKIPKSRISYKGFGTTQPLHPIPEKNIDQEFENRRVEVLIISK